MNWYVYILFSASTNTFYTGITTDPERRLNEHNTSPKGAKRTKAGRPWSLVYSEGGLGRSDALKREYQIKQLSHSAKRELVNTTSPLETSPEQPT